MTDVPTAMDKTSAGDPIPPKCAVIEVHVGELKQLFLHRSVPISRKDLDPGAEEFIVAGRRTCRARWRLLSSSILIARPVCRARQPCYATQSTSSLDNEQRLTVGVCA